MFMPPSCTIPLLMNTCAQPRLMSGKEEGQVVLSQSTATIATAKIITINEANNSIHQSSPAASPPILNNIIHTTAQEAQEINNPQIYAAIHHHRVHHHHRWHYHSHPSQHHPHGRDRVNKNQQIQSYVISITVDAITTHSLRHIYYDSKWQT